LGYIGAGEIYLNGREKDVIIRGGRNIYPHEVEEVVGNINGIRKGCTAAFPARQRDGTSEKLVVLTETRLTGSEGLARLQDDIKAVTIDLLGLAPDDIVIGAPGTVSKPSSGKIRRAACRQLYETGHLGGKKAAVWLQLAKMGVAGIRPMVLRTMGNVAALLYAGYCWLVVALFGSAVWCGLAVLPAGERCWRLVATAVRTVCRITGIRVRTTGTENFPAKEPYVLVANHMSYIDSILLTGVLPEQCHFVAKAELARNPLLYRALKKIEIFPVNRFDAEQGVEDARNISEGLRRGARPLFFAEGTLQRMPGLLPFQMGAFVLANDEQLPVVPVTIQGTRNILRGGSWFPRRGRVQVNIGKVCRPGGRGWKSAIELRDCIRQKILARLGEPDLSGEYTSLRQLDVSQQSQPF
jgi:1-acyl-sn-glycerol-3-phosphate acyltransferase